LTVIDERGRAAKIGYGLGPLSAIATSRFATAFGSPSCS